MMKGDLSIRIVEQIARSEDVDPAHLTPPLYDVIDPEALETLFRSTTGASIGSGHVEFTYKGYRVRVDSDGDVTVSADSPVVNQSEDARLSSPTD